MGPFGWMGKILEVDLGRGKSAAFSSLPYAAKFVGGRGLASRLYWERADSPRPVPSTLQTL